MGQAASVEAHPLLAGVLEGEAVSGRGEVMVPSAPGILPIGPGVPRGPGPRRLPRSDRPMRSNQRALFKVGESPACLGLFPVPLH